MVCNQKLVSFRSWLKNLAKANYHRMSIHAWMTQVPQFMKEHHRLHLYGQLNPSLPTLWDPGGLLHGLGLAVLMMGIQGSGQRYQFFFAELFAPSVELCRLIFMLKMTRSTVGYCILLCFCFSNISSFNLLLDCCSDSVLRTASSDFKKMGQRIFIFIIGGATRSEVDKCWNPHTCSFFVELHLYTISFCVLISFGQFISSRQNWRGKSSLDLLVSMIPPSSLL